MAATGTCSIAEGRRWWWWWFGGGGGRRGRRGGDQGSYLDVKTEHLGVCGQTYIPDPADVRNISHSAACVDGVHPSTQAGHVLRGYRLAADRAAGPSLPHSHSRISLSLSLSLSTHTHTHTYGYTYIRTYVFIHAHARARAHTHTNTHIHIHTHHLGDNILHEQFANEKKVLEDNRRPHPLYTVHFRKVKIECLHTMKNPTKREGERKQTNKWSLKCIQIRMDKPQDKTHTHTHTRPIHIYERVCARARERGREGER